MFPKAYLTSHFFGFLYPLLLPSPLTSGNHNLIIFSMIFVCLFLKYNWPITLLVPIIQHVCVHAKSPQSCPTLWPWLLCAWGFSRQEYWSGLPGDPPDPGIKLAFPVLHVDSFPLSHLGSPWAALCPPKCTCWRPDSQDLRTCLLFADRTFQEVIKWKRGHTGD